MTPQDETDKGRRENRLEAIFVTVRSIDEKVEEVLEKIEDCLADRDEAMGPEDYEEYLEEPGDKYGNHG